MGLLKHHTIGRVCYRLWLLALPAGLGACTGGWKEEDREIHRRACVDVLKFDYPEKAMEVCDCYIGELIVQYPDSRPAFEATRLVLDGCLAKSAVTITDDVSHRDSVLSR